MSIDTILHMNTMTTRPKTEGTRPQAEISPSEEYSIGHSVPTW